MVPSVKLLYPLHHLTQWWSPPWTLKLLYPLHHLTQWWSPPWTWSCCIHCTTWPSGGPLRGARCRLTRATHASRTWNSGNCRGWLQRSNGFSRTMPQALLVCQFESGHSTFVSTGNRIVVGIHFDIFLYSYEADFIQSLLSTGKKHLASRFNLTYRYIDDVLSINNPEFENYLGQMYPAELEIKDTTESTTSASYLDLLLSIGRDGQLHTSIYDKRDDFNFHITNFPFLSSNIPSSPAYGVFISQLIRYARACSSYECFILRARRLSSKLLKQGYLVERLKSSFRKFYGRYVDLVEQYEVTLSRMLNDILTLDQQWLPYQSDFPPISWPLYRAWPSPNYDWFPWSICNGCG